VILWVLILAVLLLTGVWVGGTFLEWALWLKILLTVLIVTGVAIALSLRRLRAVLQARRLEREIIKQSEAQAANARPERRAEIIDLQLQIRRGIEALKSSKLGQAGSSALYSLPWYILIGPPGAGKTTALKHSGLVFPFVDASGGGVRGIGGTRNCDWWFTSEGILLDTAGRYATEADDHEEWLSFLGFLRKYRPRKPVNGVLVALSVTDLVQATEEEIEVHARKLRSRIDEVMTRLGMVVPVYVVFTKMDLVAGFVEFWGDLRKSERAQVWGITFPLTPAAQKDATSSFESEFDGLAQVLHARAVRRIGQERQSEVRASILHFPLEFQSLRTNLSDFVRALFQPNAFQETPILRGAYFTSGTQEGKPIDRVIGGMLRAFNIGGTAQVHVPPAQTEPKSYFVTNVFQKVVFPDQNYAGRTRGELRRQLINRVAIATTAFLFGLLLFLPSSYSFGKNRALIASLAQTVTEAGSVPWNSPGVSVTDKARRLDDLRADLKQLDVWRQDGAPLDYRWGMYVGDELYEPLRGVYVGNLQIGFASPSKLRLEEELRAGADIGTFTTDQFNQFFSRLKAYLEACDVDHLEPDWEAPALTDAWGRALGATSKAEKDILRPHVTYYVELMKRKEIPPWTCDQDLVNRTRSYLKRVYAQDRDYSALVRDANDNVAPITRDSIFLNTAFGTFVKSKSSPEVVVTGAFTKSGWELYVRDRLGKDRSKQLAAERWVLGETGEVSQQEMDKLIKDLRDRYFTNFSRAWADFLKDLDVRQPGNNDQALDELTALSEVPWPYVRLVRALSDNTHLEESVSEQAEREILRRTEAEVLRNNALGRVLGDAGVLEPPRTRWVSPPEAAFAPIVTFGIPAGPEDPNAANNASLARTQLAHYQDQIVAKLVAVLTDLRDSKGRGVDAKSVTGAFEDAIRGTNELLGPSQSGFTRPLLSPLLLNPIELSYAGVLQDVQGEAGANWEDVVWSKWRILEDSYPFKDSTNDVKVSDFGEFFRPDNGVLFGFYNANLKASLEQEGNRFFPSTRFGHAIGYTGPFLKCYQRGLQITQATFPSKNDGPQVAFQINLHSVSDTVAEVTFDINGASHTYKNEPEQWLDVQWPPKDPTAQQSRVKIHGWSGLDEEIIRPGEWGFFRLLDAADSVVTGTEGGRRGGAQTIVVTWTLRSQSGLVKMDIRPKQDANVFQSYINRRMRIFKPYTCPRVIALGVQ
jgi:type VI secretion system protein ImpL